MSTSTMVSASKERTIPTGTTLGTPVLDAVPKTILLAFKDLFSESITLIGMFNGYHNGQHHLKEQGILEQLLTKVKAPIGLDIGAKTPAEIAISIMAEIIAQRYGKSHATARQSRSD